MCLQSKRTVKGGDLSNRYGGIMQRSSRVQKMEEAGYNGDIIFQHIESNEYTWIYVGYHGYIWD